MEDIDLLASVPLFTSLKISLLEDLISKTRIRNYRRSEVIFHKDDPGSTLYIIKSGQVKIETRSPEGEEVILAILKNGDFFGELSLLDGKPRSASAISMESTTALTLNKTDLMESIFNYPELAGNILASLSERLRQTDLLFEDAVFLDLPARLARRLVQLADKYGVQTKNGIEIDIRLTQQDLANSVGASRVAVNKLLGVFQDKTWIEFDKHRIILKRPNDLNRLIK